MCAGTAGRQASRQAGNYWYIETKSVCRDCRQAGKSAGRQLLVYRDQESVQGLQAAGKSAGATIGI